MIIAHKPLVDPEITNRMFDLYRSIDHHTLSIDAWMTQLHTDIFRSWITNGSNNFVRGLDQFAHAALCSGSSAAIDSFVARHSTRRIRFSNSEFVLSRIVATANNIPWTYLEDGILHNNDAVIISLPFAGNGSVYPGLTELLTACTTMNIPVLVDIAYIGISYDLEIDLSHPCITEVTCSVSKPFATVLRHGVRFTRNKLDDLIQSSSDFGILARANVVVASQLMQEFDKNFIANKYRDKQQEICKDLNLTPTNTITLAVGNEIDHAAFARGKYIRVCITDELLA